MNTNKLANIERAIETGESATKSILLNDGRCQKSESQVIDTESVSSFVSEPQARSRWDSEPFNKRYGEGTPVHAPRECGSPRRSFLPVSTEKPSMAPEVYRMLKEVDGSKLPSDLVSDLNRRIYYALVEFDFSLLADEARIQFFETLGCGTTEAWHYVGRSKSACVTGFRSLIDLGITILRRDRCTTALIVGKLLGLRPEYCFRTFPLKEESNYIPIENSQIQERIPNQLVVGDRHYILRSIDYLHDFRGIRVQAVCFYEDKACPQNSFFLIASLVEMNGNPTLRIGATPASARLFSRTEMAWYQDAVVFICMDNHVAKEFRHIAYESRHFERESFIISGCFGGSGAFEALDLKDLAGHAVVYVPEFNREALVSAPKFAERCEKAGATSVRIYQWPIIAGEGLVGEDLDCVESLGQDQWKGMLLENAVRIEDVALPSKFARSVCEKSLSRSDFAKWLISAGLVASANTHVDNDLDDGDDIQFICLGDITDKDTESSELITLESIVNSESSALLWAPSDAGKSFGSLEIGLGLATGTAAFGIPARCSHVVGIMDGEIPVHKKKMYARQLLQNRPELISLADRNLHIMPSPGKLKRFDEEYADILIPKVKKLGIEFLFLDNLQALDPKAGKYNAENLFAFVRKMKRAGIAIFIIHHADKDGTSYKGPTDLVDLSQTVIRGEGGDEVRKIMRNGPENTDILEACDEGGPVLRLTITKCKVGGMKGKSVIYHLPIRGVWTHLEGDLVPTIDPDPLPASVNAESEDNSAIPVLEKIPEMHGLTPDEEKVYASLKGRKCTRSQLEASTGFKTDKLGRILRKFVAHNWVKQEGAGKSTYYRGL